jgi:hypothetical protein
MDGKKWPESRGVFRIVWYTGNRDDDGLEAENVKIKECRVRTFFVVILTDWFNVSVWQH